MMAASHPGSGPLPDGIVEVDIDTYQIPTSYRPGMRVPGIIFADPDLMAAASADKSFEQVANVAHLPGIVRASMAMPDIHWGYGFPIGGVAATKLPDGAISPGGVGFDISCGVRLLRTGIEAAHIRKLIRELVLDLARSIPKGLGGKGRISLDYRQIDEVLRKGAEWCVEQGYGFPQDLDFIEQQGRYLDAEPDLVSGRAKERGLHQLGTLGSGNHFLEIQEVEKVYDPDAARVFGLEEGDVAVMIHCGSRGLGHQVCTDFVKEMARAVAAQGWELPDRQLACARVDSAVGQNYLRAMAAAANFGLANRQAITHWVRESFARLFRAGPDKLGMSLLYDVSHNIAQIETHDVDGRPTRVCVHRKGATRAFGPGRPELPGAYRELGQPVMVPGDMGTNSYVLVGTETAMLKSWGSTCHGAGRVMSRKAAVKRMSGQALLEDMAAKGIIVAAGHVRTLSEEAPYAYKDVTRVVDVCERVGLSKKVVKLRPIGVLKG